MFFFILATSYKTGSFIYLTILPRQYALTFFSLQAERSSFTEKRPKESIAFHCEASSQIIINCVRITSQFFQRPHFCFMDQLSGLSGNIRILNDVPFCGSVSSSLELDVSDTDPART